MTMADDEIAVRFDQAKDQTAQISILADLNACRVQEIVDVLHRRGRTLPPGFRPSKDRPPKKRPGKIDEDLAMELYREGRSDGDIAAHFGVTATPVRSWRKRNGLPPNFEKGWGSQRARKKPEPEVRAEEAAAEAESGLVSGGRTPEQLNAILDFAARKPTIYAQIEDILLALPAEMDINVRECAIDLCVAMLRKNLRERLSNGEE